MSTFLDDGAVADVLVVGGGPAGIAATLSLWSLGGDDLQVAWVDPTFTSGRLAKLENVHCNTKIDLMSNANHFRHPNFGKVEAVETEVQHMCATAHHLKDCTDPSQIGWTRLGSCRRIFDAATRGILSSGRVKALQGTVLACVFDASQQLWKSQVVAQSSDHGTSAPAAAAAAAAAAAPRLITSKNIIFATGAEPRQTVSTTRVATLLDMEEALDLEQLRIVLRPHLRDSSAGGRVAVLGNSHSAALVLSNLRDLASEFHQIKVTNVVRREVRFAEWMENIGSYKWNSTGLKGYGAVFGRAHMIPGTEGSSWMSIEPFDSFDESNFDFVVDCTGYVGTKLPELRLLERTSSASSASASEASGPAAPAAAAAEAAGAGAGRLVEVRPLRDDVTGRLQGLPAAYAVGAPWGEPAGILWGKGYEKNEGFVSESSFIGFRVFTDRSNLIVEHILRSNSNRNVPAASL
mmetsp:Transcript_34124/g.73768  ORF Transcript_34124/g.73768 Transcript_34124/m.73768 type:complete len:463 (+) Transcript_34124:115-1503(+)|eukprot:CAMPEP_0206438810 /NCGR_PEP_ID=MMETSP0324_2-20121206/11854_1 /ASSEMBLY_ACC=CAM_ASM_000836 /TAXON_ID=2866 /ORGANISM="Crypthecodinium cohnii, Strain Seligo" /LENGTH=462 /DNA_ID=CAMNT_0053906345 /DNA_START=50 /DNA_END=1438 /DNA_ORIENTATION=-